MRVAFLLLASIALAESRVTPNTLSIEGTESAKATLADVSWIAGHWKGDALGGTVEEIWSAPAAGNMMGMFRLIKNNAVVFHELLTITEESGGVIMRLKHFHRDMKGWEEKDEVRSFRLLKVAPGEAWFQGMTLKKDGDTGVTVFLAIKDKNGMREEKFTYRRVR